MPRLLLPTTLSSLRTALTVRFTAPAMVLRARRILRVRRALRMRSSFRTRSRFRTWSRLRTRARLPTATTELTCRLGGATWSRTLRGVAHLVGLIDARLNAAVGLATGTGHMVVACRVYVRRHAAPTASRATARAAVDLGATATRRTIVSHSRMSDIAMTRTSRPTAGLGSSRSTAMGLGTASSSRPIASAGDVRRLTMTRAARRTSRPTAGLGATSSSRPIASAAHMRRLTVTRDAGPAARAATDLSASSSTRRPITTTSDMIRPTVAGSAAIGSVNIRATMARSAVVGSMHIGASSRPPMVIPAVVGRARSGGHYPST